MTNKTITLAREQLEQMLSRAEVFDDGGDGADAESARSLAVMLRAALTDPVPPAGGEPEEWCDKLHLLKVIQDVVSTNRMQVERPTDAEAANAIYRAISEHLPIYEDVYDQVSELIEPLVARPHRPDGALPASVVGAVGVLLKDHTRLQAEVERLKAEWDKEAKEWYAAAGEDDALVQNLQSELTKARELLADVAKKPWMYDVLGSVREYVANQSAPADKGESVASAVFNDPLYNAESDARNASAMLEEVIELFDDGVGRSTAEFKLMRKIGDWLGRSVPRIDGGSDECAHSEANKIGCPECGEVFK